MATGRDGPQAADRSRLRLLVLDAYDASGREALRRAGGTEAGLLYARLLQALEPGACVDVARPADADPGLPSGVALADYDGAVWTGSSLTIHRPDERVERQVELARTLGRAGVPQFGSCWAAQLAAVAAGGACGPSPRGREFGVARKLVLSDDGRAHPLYRGKPAVFDAFASHADEVTRLPPGARVLASNAASRVQALAVEGGAGSFWAVQYHPEYDLREIARLAVLRIDELVAQGTFRDHAAALGWAERLEALHREPGRRDLAFELGLDDDVLDPERRTREVRNWLVERVRPRRGSRTP